MTTWIKLHLLEEYYLSEALDQLKNDNLSQLNNGLSGPELSATWKVNIGHLLVIPNYNLLNNTLNFSSLFPRNYQGIKLNGKLKLKIYLLHIL